MANKLVKSNLHQWQFNRCVNCGIEREVIDTGHFFKTIYRDNRGIVLIKPKCSGQFRMKQIK